VQQQPGGQTNWKLGWDDNKPKQASSLLYKLVNKYRNQSNVVFGGDNEHED
jgi:hypothetical protein